MSKKKINGLGTTFGLVGAGLGMDIVGDAIGSSDLQSAGAVTTSFVPISANIHGASMSMNMLKKLKK